MSLETNIKSYKEERKSLLKNKKMSLFYKLTSINQRLEKSVDINDFFIRQINENTNEMHDSIKNRNSFFLVFIIKIIGGIFVTLYLIGVFEIIGIMDAIEEELFSSVLLYFLRENKEKRTDFYHNYINLAIKIPSFAPFYLSSLLSNIIINFFGFYLTTILVIIINILTIYFGVNNFDFHKDELLEENYTLKEFLALLFIFICFYISVGIVALVPLDIIQDGFKDYDKHKSKKMYENLQRLRVNIFAQDHAEEEGYEDNPNKILEEKKRLEGLIKEEEKKAKDNIVNKKKEDLDLNDTCYKAFLLNFKMNINGFLIFYLASMSFSSICVIILNRIFMIDYSEKNKISWKFILMFSTPMIFALIFYKIYSIVFGDENTKNNKQIKTIKFGGYIIYQEKVLSDENCCVSCCSDCIECLQKLDYGCCCQLCGCSYLCKSIFGCKCSCSNNVRKQIPSSDYQKENICIIYKVNGICSWVVNTLTNPRVLIFVPILYIFNALNIGFDYDISQDIEEHKNKAIISYIISLSSRIIFYVINYLGGLFLIKKLYFYNDNEFYTIINGFILIIFFESIFSAIISILIYSNLINGDLKDFLMTVSLESKEYIEIVCLDYFSLYFEINLSFGDFLSNSSILTFYLIIWKFFELMIEILNFKNAYLLIFQFSFGIILSFAIIIFTICLKDRFNNIEDIENLIEELDV